MTIILSEDINLMKEVNIMGYFLEMLELMKSNPLPIEQLIVLFAVLFILKSAIKISCIVGCQ